MSRIKKKVEKHLSETVIDIAARGKVSKRARKHLDRCGTCSNKVRDLKAALYRQAVRKRREQEGLQALALILRCIQPSPPKSAIATSPGVVVHDDGYCDEDSKRIGEQQRWLSGAEWDAIKRRLPYVIAILALFLILYVTSLVQDPVDRETYYQLVIVGDIALMVAGFFRAIEYLDGYDDDTF